MDARVQVVNVKKEKKSFYHTKIWRPPSSNSEDPLGVPDPLLKTPGLKQRLNQLKKSQIDALTFAFI